MADSYWKIWAWNRIAKICSDNGFRSAADVAACKDPVLAHKVNRQCLHVANILAALTGDTSLIPPEIMAERQNLLDMLPAALKSAEEQRRDKEAGQMSLFQ